MIFALIIIHVPLSVFFGTQFPDVALLIKAWKEIIMLIAAILVVICSAKKHLWKNLFSDKIIWLTLAFIGVHLLSLWQWNGLDAAMAGLMIGLRFVVYFRPGVCVDVAGTALSPNVRESICGRRIFGD